MKKNQWIPPILLILFGVAIGILSSRFSSARTGTYLGSLLSEFLILCIVIFLHTILHEVGHLLAGLISGYRLVSFRIGTLTLIHTNDKWQLKRYSILGTAGQCLMAPKDGETPPYRLFNLGGVLMNAILAIIGSVFFYVFRNAGLLAFSLGNFAVFGFYFALSNGIPILFSGPNDGYNVLSISRSDDEKQAFYHHLSGVRLLSAGIAAEDMPEDIFTMPDDFDDNMPLSAGVTSFIIDRLMGKGEYEQAVAFTDEMLRKAPNMAGLFIMNLQAGAILCHLAQGEIDQANERYTPKVRQFIRSSKMPLMVLVASLMEQGNIAQQKAKQFEKIAAKYCFPTEIVTLRRMQKQAAEYRNI